jgi:hypothetical protein
MTSFADCIDLLPDDLTEGQIQNFLDHAKSECSPILPNAMEVLEGLIHNARGEPLSGETIAGYVSTAYAIVGSGNSDEFLHWADTQGKKKIASAGPSTTPIALRLSTPTALQRGLRLFGLHWLPQIYDRATLLEREHDTEPGLYCWVTAGFQAGLMDPLEGGVLYIGIGDGRTGWRKRLRDEWGWIDTEADHGHGMAMHRTNAKVVGSPVKHVERPLTWLTQSLVGENDRVIPLIHEYLRNIAAGELAAARAAESIAIRLAIDLGDTGAPVNSAGAGAWATNRPEDWAGFAAARFMEA